MKNSAAKKLVAALATAVFALTACSPNEPGKPDPQTSSSQSQHDGELSPAELGAKIADQMRELKFYKCELKDSTDNSVDTYEVDLSDPNRTKVHRVVVTGQKTDEFYEFGNEATYIRLPDGKGWTVQGPPMPPFDFTLPAEALQDAEKVRLAGSETIRGIETKHYVATFPYEDGERHIWVDDQWRIVRHVVENYDYTLWDHGVPNEIVAPK